MHNLYKGASQGTTTYITHNYTYIHTTTYIVYTAYIIHNYIVYVNSNHRIKKLTKKKFSKPSKKTPPW